MKIIVFCLVLISLVNFSFSQNWSLVNQNRTVFFEHSDSVNITNTIFIDSSETIGVNTDYYTSYALKYCDTCQSNNYYHRYSNEFLGFNVQDDAMNNQFLLDSNIIKQHSAVNDSWPFSAGIMAITANKIEVSVLGVLDSVKTLALSTNDTIIISKNHGVIRYPDFENTGKYYEMVGYHEGQNSYGEYLPNFWRTYDFNGGDLLSDRFFRFDFDYYEHKKATVEILSKVISGDTIQFTCKTLGTGQYDNTQTNYQSYSTTNYVSTVVVVNNVNSIENCTGESQIYPSNSPSFFAGQSGPSSSSNFIGTYTYIDPVFGLSVKHLPLVPIGDSLYIWTASRDALSFSMKTGLLVSSFSGLSPNHNDSLVGTVISGDTIGTIYNFPDDLGIKPSLDQENFNFYPNPAKDKITIPSDIINLKIYSTLGQFVMETKPSSQVVDISALTEGVYFIIAFDDMEVTRSSKLVVR